MKLWTILSLLLLPFLSIRSQELTPREITTDQVAVLAKIYAAIEQGSQELFMHVSNGMHQVEKQEAIKKRIEELINYYDAICFLPLLYLGVASIADNFSVRFNKTTPSDLKEIGVSFEQVSKNFTAMADEFRKKATVAYAATRSRLSPSPSH
jgi:hypothetical protein